MDSAELRLFDQTESALVARALGALDTCTPQDADSLRVQLAGLAELSRLVSDTPSLYVTETFAGKVRSLDSLLKHLCSRFEMLLHQKEQAQVQIGLGMT